MSGTAIANLKLKPIPPSSNDRHNPGNPETSYAIKMTSGLSCLANKLAIIR